MKEKLVKSSKIILKTIGISIAILIIISLTRCTYQQIKINHLVASRTKMTKYFIENIDEFKNELKSMGYEAKVYHKVGDIYNWNEKENIHNLNFNKNIGFEEKGILKLNNKTKVFSFDRGLDSIDFGLGNSIYVSMFRVGSATENTPPLYYNDGSYSVEVSLSAPEYKEVQWNYYNTDFEKYRLFNGDDELGADVNIKKYISAQELRNILQEGKELEYKLVKLYKERNK